MRVIEASRDANVAGRGAENIPRKRWVGQKARMTQHTSLYKIVHICIYRYLIGAGHRRLIRSVAASTAPAAAYMATADPAAVGEGEGVDVGVAIDTVGVSRLTDISAVGVTVPVAGVSGGMPRVTGMVVYAWPDKSARLPGASTP